MIFLYFAVAILGSATTSIWSRHILKNASAHSFAMFTNVISALFFIPIALSNISFTNNGRAWLALIIASSLWAAAALMSAISVKETHASIRAPLNQLKLLWSLLFSALILKEVVGLPHLIGGFIIFIGLSILLYHPEYKFGSLKDSGVRWTFISAVMSAAVAIADKYTLNFFSVELYGFIVFMIPSIILFFFTPNQGEDMRHLWKNYKKDIVLFSALMVITYYAVLKIYSLIPVSIAYPVLQLSTLVTVIGGIFILKEKEHLWQKMIATTIVIIGAIILKLS